MCYLRTAMSGKEEVQGNRWKSRLYDSSVSCLLIQGYVSRWGSWHYYTILPLWFYISGYLVRPVPSYCLAMWQGLSVRHFQCCLSAFHIASKKFKFKFVSFGIESFYDLVWLNAEQVWLYMIDSSKVCEWVRLTAEKCMIDSVA